MAYRQGFTIIELAVVLTIMAILLVLGVSGYSSSQANARDSERKATANNIAQALERYYRSGNTAGGTTYPAGNYPDSSIASNSSFLASILPGLDRNSFNYSFNTSAPSSFFVVFTADNPPLQTVSSGVSTTSTTSNVVYQPVAWNGSAWIPCTVGLECRRFMLYYRTENGNAVQTIESRVQ